MLKENFQKFFVEVLERIQKTKDIAEDEEAVNALIQKANNETTNHLTGFIIYLQEDCGLPPRVIATVVESLLSNPNIRQALNIKIILLWLLFKIYEILDIHINLKGNSKNKDRRRKVREAFVGYNFSGSDLLSLLRVCCAAVGQGTEDIQDMADMIVEGRAKEIEQVFYKEPQPQPEVYSADKSIQEQLRDLIADYKVMPEASLQKELQRELILAHMQKNKTERSTVEKELPHFKHQSDIESLRKKYSEDFMTITADIEELLQKAQTERAYQVLCALKSKIFSINVLELERLINKTNDAKKLIEEKDVIFMMGITGSGKSTNILKFLGYDLKRGKRNDLITLVPTGELHKDHKTFYTSPEAKSCTRYINAVSVPSCMYRKGLAENRKTLVLCDSPGFGDSAGVEVDIANGVGMINALHGARSVRVVVILPFDSLTGGRLSGAVKMSEIISSLFHELTVIESIAIYFNKVPADMITEVPKLVRSKLQNLTEIERSNQKLTTFLKEILERSQEEENFIDPLKSDYKKLFDRLYTMPAIGKVRENFQYDFTDSTKREIEKFVQDERSKVRELFAARKYRKAQFHLRMVDKMMNILHNNDKIRACYQELIIFVQGESEKELTFFEETVAEVMASKESQSLRTKLYDSKAKIIEIEELFKDFDFLEVVSASKIDDIVQEQRARLLGQFSNLAEVTAETVAAVKSFSALIDRDLEGKVLQLVEKRFKDVYNEVEHLVRSKSYGEMGQNLKFLGSLAGFQAQLAQKEASSLANRLKDLKATLSKEVQACFACISENITKGEVKLSENIIRETNQNVKRIKEIAALNFLENSAEVRRMLAGELRLVESRCKRIIRDLEDLRLTLNEDVEGKASIDKDELVSKKRQIELLMKVENLEESLAEDYAYAKESIKRKLRENVDILKTCIEALRSNKNEEIYRSLENIKKATMVVLKCSQIVGEPEGLEIAESIGNEFIQYLGGEKAKLYSIEFKLSQINDQTLRRVQEYYSKIESYSKMGSISPQVQLAVGRLKTEINEKLKAPFLEFKKRELTHLQEQRHYRFIPYSIDKFERFSAYAFGIEDIVPNQEYVQISECEGEIREGIEPFYKAMEADIEAFVNLDFAHGSFPTYLKDLVKTLLAINQKSKACEYLTHNLNFDVAEKLNYIESKLHEIKDKMHSAFEENQTNAEVLLTLIPDCKFFGEIEDIYKSKGELENKFGFRELQWRCSEEFGKSLKSDEERCKQIIEGNKPTKIAFQELQTYYENFISLKSQEGVRKRRVITSELRKVEQKTLNDLKEFRQEINNCNLNISNPTKMEDFLEALNEAIALERSLNKLYSLEEDRTTMQIRQSIGNIGLKIIKVFQSDFEIVIADLKEYRLASIGEKLNAFGQLETMIYEVFSLDSEDLNSEEKEEREEKEATESEASSPKGKEKKPGDSMNGEDRLADFIKQNVSLLRVLIESHPYIKEGKITAKSTKRLKNLLQIFRRGVELDIKAKYDDGSSLIIDEQFDTFYSHCSKEKQNELKNKVANFLNQLVNKYKENYNTSNSIAKQTKKKIEESIHQLPAELRNQQKKIFEDIKKALVKESDEAIAKASKNIISNPITIGSFFALAKKALHSEEAELHGKFVQSFVDIYSKEEERDSTLEPESLDKKMAFVEASFTGVLMRNSDYLKEDKEMLKEFTKKYNYWLTHLAHIGKGCMEELLKMSSTTSRAEKERASKPQLLVAAISKAYNFFLKLKDDAVVDFKNFRQICFYPYKKKMEDVVGFYSKTLKKCPEEKLNSKEILNPTVIRKLQSYVEEVSLASAVVDEFRLHFNGNQSISGLQSSNDLSALNTADSNIPVLQSYENQFAEMLRFVVNFDLCSDLKRNFAPKEIEEDFNQLNLFFEILQARQDFFTKYIIKEPKNQYKFTTLSQSFAKKLEAYVREGEEEINETFRIINGDPAVKINLLIKQLSLMNSKNRDLKFVPAEKVKESADKINKLLKSKFDWVRDECNRTLDAAKAEFCKVSKEVQGLSSKKRDEVTKERSKYKAMIDSKVSELRKQCDKKVNLETEESKKQEYRKALTTEENSTRNDLQSQRDSNIKKIEDQFEGKLSVLNEVLDPLVTAFVIAITIFQKALIDIFEEVNKYKKYLETVLEGLSKISPKFVKLVQNCLLTNPNDYRSIGKLLLASSKAFANFNVAEINKLIRGQDISYVLNNLQRITLTGRDMVPANEIKSIENMYNHFKKKYDEYKDRFKSSPSETTIKYIITELRDLGNQIKTDFYQTINPLKQAKNKVELLAGIFALWAILKAETFEGEVQYTIEPHPTQITTLILLLGISHPDEKQSNRLAQVGTGEGKSIVLAGLSSYLALVGFKVRCACYSSYLSARDQESFNTLFERLGVENSIKYGTFNSLCEDILNGSGGSLKDQVEKMILQPPQGFFEKFSHAFGFNKTFLNRGPNEILQSPTILVIDEVDVFFDDSFFGSTYCPAITLRDKTISNFLEFVWREVQKQDKDTDPQSLIASKEFQEMVNRYPSLKELLKNQVHGMVAGALNYKHEYFIIDKRIAYKDNDSISYKINYGYKTVFAYLHEFQHNRVSRAYLDDALQISLMVAEFSYAALPKYFCNILGVTGTLQVLPQYKKSQLTTRYEINDQYAIPSAFGVKKQRVEEYQITESARYTKKIVEIIKSVQDNRPVIIFFKGPRELNEFFNSPDYHPFLKRTYNLTEEHDASVRDSRIFNAVEPGKITLMTSAFGRGTDFMVRNDKVKENGGLHIIQAFLSLDESEEVQIKGRTARQNSRGSYDCTLDEGWLEQLALTLAQIPKNATSDGVHSILLKAREERIEKLSKTTIKMLEEADSKHKNVVAIFSKEKLAQGDLIKYVSSLNQYPEIRKVTIKTVLGLDATGSMEGPLKKTCEIISFAFEQTYAVLKEKSVKATIEVKIMAYRNYNSPAEEIIEGTTFESTPVNLKLFLSKLKTKGGWGNEALEVLFQFLNKEEKIDQVILIGDAPPNTPTETTQKRVGEKFSRGEAYWCEKGFPKTEFEKEIQAFKLKRCPVHTFYLGKAQSAFKRLSAATGGKSSAFNLHTSKASEQLTQFVVENMLSLIEKNSGSGRLDLVEAYRKMFIN